jgi:type I restriction-modification system DNA methylase subunit
MSVREENLNITLAELLAEKGLKALGEVILRKKGRRPEPDVLIELNGVRIIIEGKKPGMWDALVAQCAERLDNNVCDLCVMVEYADFKLKKLVPNQVDVKEALLGGKFNIGFLSYVDRAGLDKWMATAPKPEQYNDVSFDDLLTYLMSAYSRIVREDIIEPVINRMNEVLEDFAIKLSTTINLERLKEVLELHKTEEEQMASKDAQKLVSTAGLLLVDALVFHEIIAASHKNVPTLSTIMSAQNVKKELETSWQYIIHNIDYEPVLDIALDILMNIPASAVLDKQLRSLANLAYDIASSKVLLRHDLFGRIYHKLLLGKLVKYYATYYTSIPAARLLARLLLNLPSDLDAKTAPPTFNGEPLRIVDFACGSGTLLSAICKEIDARHRIEADNLMVDEVHKYLVEEGIWGFDVLHHAVHLAATVLSLHNPIPVEDSKLFALRLGDGKYLGSVNFLSSSELGQEMLLTTGHAASRGAEKIGVKKKRAEAIALPNFHFCIMNPPFTRSVGGNLLFGSLPKKERAELQKSLSQVLKEKGLTGIGQAGLGAVFVFIADKYLEENGRLGVVLPRAVLSGVSWQKVREKLLADYHLEYIITSYETHNGWNFSENTNLSEVLIVARKKKKNEEPHYTYFANLWKKPSNELESIHLGTQLKELYTSGKLYDIENSNASPYHLKLHGKKVGEVYSAMITDSNFGVYNIFSQMELNRTLLFLRKGIVYLPDQGIVGNLRLTTLARLGAEIGPDRRQVHSTFSFSETSVGSMYKTLWGYDSSITKTILQKPNGYLDPKNARQARELWKRSGDFLIVERARLNTYTVLAAYLDEVVLSNVWWPINTNEDNKKILAIWMNSTFGLLLLLSMAEVTCGPWVDFKKEHLQAMPVIDVPRLSHKAKVGLLDLYQKRIGTKRIDEMEFKAIPEEFANPVVRKIIDDEICKQLGFQFELDTLHKLLAQEPMLTG